MKCLFRFEDTYGIADMLALLNDYSPALWNKGCVNHMGVFDVRIGLNIASTLHTPKKELLENIALGYTDIVAIFDLDSDSADKRILLTSEKLKKSIAKTEKDYRANGYTGNLHYIPATYCAETITLYQFLGPTGYGTEVESIVSNWNTPMLHLMLVAKLIKCGEYKYAKRVRNYFQKDVFVSRVQAALAIRPNCVNCKFLEWLLSPIGPPTFNNEEALTIVDAANMLFFEWLDKQYDFQLRGMQLHTNMSKREIEQIYAANK